MRILLVVVYYPPSTTSAANMMRDLALELFRCGHRVTVVTPSDSIEDAFCVSEEDSVTVVRVKTSGLKSATRILRLWRESRLSAGIWMKAQAWFRKNPSDLIVFYSPTIFFGELISRLKALWGCPSYLVHRDIFPQWAVDAGVLRAGGILHRFLRHEELKQYAAADIIGVEAPGNLRYFDYGRQGSNFQAEVLYNWVGATTVPTGASKWRSKLGLDGKVVFVYGGNIGVAQDMDNILRLASSLRDRDDVFFLLIGEGSETVRLNLDIDRLGLTNIKILAAMAQTEYLECLAEFDVGVISLNRNFRSNNFTGKLLGYVSCGKPVLASVNPGNDLIEFLHRADAGIACANGDDCGLRSATLLLATNPEVRKRMGMNAHALASTTFSVQTIAEQIISHFCQRERQQPNARAQSAHGATSGVH
jgi:glycosyltransferase involved in cell wall biosynthesis